MEILLNKVKSKRSRDVNNSLATNLIGSKKLLPQQSFFDKINEIEVYNQERNACNIIRLNCVVNPICSNVLFNSISEIVKNEGDPNSVKLLNYGEKDGYISSKDFDNKIYCKASSIFVNGTFKEAIRDTQISTEKCGFKYHCGIDMFNNHIMRNNTFKTVCYYEPSKPTNNGNVSVDPTAIFNTINDYMRDENGTFISGEGYGLKRLDRQHLYTSEDIETYENTIDYKLIEKNGWFGFTNIGKFAVVDKNNEPMDIFRIINYKRSCDFIQMSPSSDLWSFTPKYNSYVHRLEKNWNYCLTYPSSSTTQNITFIRENTNSLKIMYIDDRVRLKSGVKAVKIYSVSKHGLKKGDYINFYQNDTMVMKECEVREVENDYIFYIFNPNGELFKLKYELTKADTDTMGIDDFYVKIFVPLASYSLKANNQDCTENTSTFTATTSGISKSNITVNTSASWKTIKYHGKAYDLIFKTSRILNLDPYASGTTNVSVDDIEYDLSFEEIGKNKYEYTISNVGVNMEMQYQISSDRNLVYCGHGDDRQTYYLIDNKFVNIDDNAQDFSYKKVVDGEEVDYYVRIFSRLPNWKGCGTKIDKNQLYGTDKHLIAQYQTLDHDFENHISQLAFAKNVYGDDISQIVYTDDIDITYLRDNLGRPLTSIYLTILKNNKGYKEWYGKNGIDIKIRKRPQDNDEDYHVEYSHCFGMLNCAFRLSKESLPNVNYNNSMQINNIDSSFQYQGLDVEDIQHSNVIYEKILNDKNIVDQEKDDDATLNRSYRSKFPEILNDEVQYGDYYDYEKGIKYLGDTHFYGDLCAYSRKRLVEEPIQQVEMRFNTAQREISSLDTSYQYFKKFYYDEIISDDKDPDGFVSKEYVINNAHQHKEGYCYYPHYEIPIKTFDKKISSYPSVALTLTKIDAISDEKERAMRFKIKTLNPHRLQKNDTIYMRYNIFDLKTNAVYQTFYYICYVSDIINKNIFECIIYDEKHKRINTLNTTNVLAYRLFKKDNMIPDYATFTKDGSCRFMWRNVINNGFDNDSDIEEYPFFNGAFYVSKQINLFVKRQDPQEVTKLQSGKFPNDITPNQAPDINKGEDNVENEMSC